MAWAYAATGENELLEAAERAAGYFFDHRPTGQGPRRQRRRRHRARLPAAGGQPRSTYSVPQHAGIEEATAFGDFYLGLALACAVRALDPADLVHRA